MAIPTALLMYGIDSLIDWMLDKGTDFISAQINALEASAELAERMIAQVEVQFEISARYREMARTNEQINAQFNRAGQATDVSIAHAFATVQSQDATMEVLVQAIDAKKHLNERLGSLLQQFKKEK